MKHILVILVTIILVISSSEQSTSKLATNVTNCPLLLPVAENSQTIFFDLSQTTHLELKNCILKNCHSEQSVLLLNMYVRDITIQINVSRPYIRTTDNPIFIVMMENFTSNMIDSPLLKAFIKSRWSLLYIIVTSDSKFTCNDGTMNRKDFILLDNIMNKLWHKFNIMHVGVAFPFACQQKMAIYNGKRPSNQILYDRPIQLVNNTNSKYLYGAILESGKKLSEQYPMKGSIFYRYPTSITDCNKIHYYRHFNLSLTGGFCGLDGMVMHDVLSHFKFNLSFSNDEICNNYGYVSPGNVSGSLGCIIRKELDISYNSRFMTLYSDEKVYYLHYVTIDSLCALVKISDVIPIWHSAFNVYKGELWLLIMTVVVTIGVIMWATAIILEKITGERSMTVWFYLHDAVMTTMFGCSLRKRANFYILRVACLFGSVILVAVYQGHINHVFTTLQRFENFKTLVQLYKSGATLYTSPSMREFLRQLQNPQDKLERDFFNRTRLMPGDRLGVILQRPSVATLGRKSDAMMEILKNYSDKSGKPLIDIVDECFYTYYVSYITRTGFPFFEDLKSFIERLNEAGLPNMYYKWTQRMLGVPDSIPQFRSEPRPFSKLTLEDQRVAFGILCFGLVGSVIVFIAEMWRGRNHHN